MLVISQGIFLTNNCPKIVCNCSQISDWIYCLSISLKSPKAAGTDTADVAVAYSIYNPPSTLRTPPTPLGLPLPSLFTSLSLKRRLCYVIVFLLSLFILPIPRFWAGALFSAIVTTVFWSMYLIAEVGLTPATVEEKKKTPVDKYEDGKLAYAKWSSVRPCSS